MNSFEDLLPSSVHVSTRSGQLQADLYAHSLWALLERRGRLLEADAQLATSLAQRVEVVLAEGDLSAQSRRELEQVHYGVRLLHKS